ncbi:hypothetical protein [Alteraurantiacibacter aquimixticola]|uniref:Uncharacterized protein n=1 Tax=Alteraurantiacibacter aquimixticola TaxID=2489173 RepID=A0A4T3EXG5_9SPHN|nr:hypothetical protein [Alteraurantiacibacter aquimixticola]TIX49158.1 hypothetical protein E5222_15685 [Alteraurantiacibacter aquimixticola]
MRIQLLIIAAAPLLLGGCLARTAVEAVSLPVKAASSAVDLATTSQSEADQTRGREIRRREERLGQLQEEYDELAADCEDGDDKACREAIAVRREIDALIPTIPVEPV